MRYASWAVFAITVVLAGGVFWIAWNNRASEKVVGSLLPILIAAVVGVVVVLAFSGEAVVTHTFPAKATTITAVVSTSRDRKAETHAKGDTQSDTQGVGSWRKDWTLEDKNKRQFVQSVCPCPVADNS